MASENTRFLHCQIGHHTVQPFKLRQRKGIEFTQQVICLIRILDLLNFLLRSDHRLTADYAFDFVQRKRVGLNRQRGMNRANALLMRPVFSEISATSISIWFVIENGGW